MAKRLRQPTPSSSVARLFDIGAAARAIGTAEAAPTTHNRETQAPFPGEPANVKRELTLTPSTESTFVEIVSLYQRSTGTKLTASHVARAVLSGFAHCMESLEKEAKSIGRLNLPSNARGREADRQRFEERIARAIIAGIRAAPAFPSD